MATENKAVMVYLPPDLESFVGRYCEQNKLIFTKDGKEQPRLGTGILRLLSDMANGAATVKDSPDITVKDSDTETRLEKLETDLESGLTMVWGELRSIPLTEIENRLGTLEGELENISDPAPLIDSLRSEMVAKLESLEGEVSDLKKL